MKAAKKLINQLFSFIFSALFLYSVSCQNKSFFDKEQEKKVYLMFKKNMNWECEIRK